MIQIKTYQCDNSHPSDDEIREGIAIANSDKCMVKLHWKFPYSGDYSLCIMPEMTFDDCKSLLPTIYPV